MFDGFRVLFYKSICIFHTMLVKLEKMYNQLYQSDRGPTICASRKAT